MFTLTKEEAIVYGDSNAWKTLSKEQLALFQLEQPYMCVDSHVFFSTVQEIFKDSEGGVPSIWMIGMCAENLARTLRDRGVSIPYSDIAKVVGRS